MPELKPCPFCGGEAELAHLRKRPSRIFGIYRPAYVRCTVCYATGRTTYTTEFAIEAWNMRVKK